MGNMESFVDELTKIASAGQALLRAKELAAPIAKKYWKPVGLVGLGAGGYHVGKKELDKYLLGRQVYERMQGG